MVEALCPSLRRWLQGPLVLLVALLAACPSTSLAQQGRNQSRGAAAEKPAEADQPDDQPQEAGVVEAEPGTLTSSIVSDRYQDPNAAKALPNKFPELYQNTRILQRVQTDVDRMAQGRERTDRQKLQEYVRYQAALLTKHGNIEAMTTPGGDPGRVEQISDAGRNLVRPLLTAGSAGNGPGGNMAFRQEYSRALLQIAPDMLKNQLYARTMMAVALSHAGSPDVVPILVEQLKDGQQTLTVRMLAAVGLTEVARVENYQPNPNLAIPAADAVVVFLQDSQNNWWPAQVRAIEAIGSLRQASREAANPESEFAAALLGFLSDGNAHLGVRAWSAWALGMLRPSSRNADYNFALIASQAGRAAGDLGTQILDLEPEDSKKKSGNEEVIRRYTNWLLQLLVGLRGNPNIPNSGLTQAEHPNLAKQRSMVQAIEGQVQAVTEAAVNLSGAIGTQRPSRRKALQDAVEALNAFLADNPPESLTLVSGGPEYPLPEARQITQQASVEARPKDQKKGQR